MIGRFLVLSPRRRRALRMYDDACTVLYHLCRQHPEPVEFHSLCRISKLPADRVENVLENMAKGPFITSRRVTREAGSPARFDLDLITLTDTGWAVFSTDVWRP